MMGTTSRGHLQLQNYQDVSSPDNVYDYAYARSERQPEPIQLRNVKTYIDKIKEDFEKNGEDYQVCTEESDCILVQKSFYCSEIERKQIG